MKMRKSRKQEAFELAEKYQERGVAYCYNERNHNVYLSLLEAPYCVPNVDGCQLTGYIVLYGGVEASKDIDTCINKLVAFYKKAYENNQLMLDYLKTVKI